MWTIRGGGNTQTLLVVKKKFELIALPSGGDIKTSGARPCSIALTPNERPGGISST